MIYLSPDDLSSAHKSALPAKAFVASVQQTTQVVHTATKISASQTDRCTRCLSPKTMYGEIQQSHSNTCPTVVQFSTKQTPQPANSPCVPVLLNLDGFHECSRLTTAKSESCIVTASLKLHEPVQHVGDGGGASQIFPKSRAHSTILVPLTAASYDIVTAINSTKFDRNACAKQ